MVAVLKNDKFWNYFGKCSRRQHLLLILQILWVFRQALHFTIWQRFPSPWEQVRTYEFNCCNSSWQWRTAASACLPCCGAAVTAQRAPPELLSTQGRAKALEAWGEATDSDIAIDHSVFEMLTQNINVSGPGNLCPGNISACSAALLYKDDQVQKRFLNFSPHCSTWTLYSLCYEISPCPFF